MSQSLASRCSLLVILGLIFPALVPLAGAQSTPEPATPEPATPAAVELETETTLEDAPTCTAGSVGAGDPYFPTMGNGGYDVWHYDLDLTLDVSGGEIEAATVTIEALALANLCSFNLDFEGLTIDGVTVDGEEADYARHFKELTVTPDEPIEAGETFITTVTYHGTPVIADLDSGSPAEEAPGDLDPAEGIGGGDPHEMDAIDSGWFVADDEIFIIGEPSGSRFWYPVNEHPLDKATYTASYTVPEPFVVVANGTLIEETDHGDTITYVWDSRDPMAPYLVMFHAGMLEIEEIEGPDGLPVLLSFAPNVPDAQREVFRTIPEMMAFAESVFGPYPFESIGATVASPVFFHALETQTIPIYGSFGEDRDEALSDSLLLELELTIFHEIAHQWYGNAVTIQSWHDIWLNEGFAAYAESLWLEHTRGIEARDAHLRSFYVLNEITARFNDPEIVAELTARDVLEALDEMGACEDDCFEIVGPMIGAETEADLDEISAEDAIASLEENGVPRDFFPGIPMLTGNPGPANLFSWAGIYGRGSLTVHALRLEIGDEAFFKLLPLWVERFHNGHAGTADLILLAEEVSGQQLDELFDAWLYQYELPPLDLGDGEAESEAAAA